MSYRDPLDAARARIAALEDLLDSQRFGIGAGKDGDGEDTLREARVLLAEERAEHHSELEALRREVEAGKSKFAEIEEELVRESARRQAEVSLLRSKLEESERAALNHSSVFEAEQTMQRAQAEAESARLRQELVYRDTQIRELREEVRVHLGGEPRAVRAFYEARVRVVGTDLAEQGTLARRLKKTLAEAHKALDKLPPADSRDREGMVERELSRRKVAIGEAELERVEQRVERLESELERITGAEAKLAER